MYTVSEILLVTFLAVICVDKGCQDVENYGKAKINYLRNYLVYENGVPSDDTIRCFFPGINPEHFKAIFHTWAENIANLADAKVSIIDGNGEMLHMVSAFATEACIVLDQEKTLIKAMKLQLSQNCWIYLILKGILLLLMSGSVSMLLQIKF